MPAADSSFDAGIAANLQSIQDRIHAVAVRAGRDPAGVRLVAVSKTFPAEAVRAAAATGHRAFGENRVQEGLDKAGTLASLNLEWHLIGHLQSNKAKKAAQTFAWIHSLDSLELLRKIDAAAVELGTRPRLLIQVDLAHEATKSGVDASEVPALARAALDGRAVELMGLMIVPPFPVNPEDSRPWFRRLRELRDALVAGGVPADRLRELSMGMTHDVEIAIEEGATMVRVGTAIFGKRTPPLPA